MGGDPALRRFAWPHSLWHGRAQGTSSVTHGATLHGHDDCRLGALCLPESGVAYPYGTARDCGRAPGVEPTRHPGLHGAGAAPGSVCVFRAYVATLSPPACAYLVGPWHRLCVWRDRDGAAMANRPRAL